MYQITADLRLIETGTVIGELRNLSPLILYKIVRHIANVRLRTFTDMAQTSNCDYIQTGLIGIFHVWDQSKRRQLYYFIDWSSHRQKQICHLSYGTEVLAAEAAEDRGTYF